MSTENQNIPDSRKHRFALVFITFLFIVGGILFAVYYIRVLSKRAQTEDAYVGGNMVSLSSQVAGNVTEIMAEDTQFVHAGAVVVKLDPTDASVALRRAAAELGATVRQLRERYLRVAQYHATVAEKRLHLQDVGEDLERRQPLAGDHAVSAEVIAHARQAVNNARASLNVAIAEARAAGADVAGVALAKHPSILAAKAAYIQAWLTLRRDAIRAPVSGYVAERRVQVGSHVAPGTTLMSIVPLNQLWVDANFKESDLGNIRVGQPARIEADIYGGKVVFHGRVLGLSPGPANALSLLAAQNATGNWIKVVQRVPVRISLKPKELVQHPLRIGLSTEVTVDTHDTSGPILGTPIPAEPVYSTQALGQPLHEAEAAADAIIARNLAK